MTKTPLEIWEEKQLIAAAAQQNLQNAVQIFDAHKFELSPEDRQATEKEIIRNQVAIEEFLMAARGEYLEAEAAAEPADVALERKKKLSEAKSAATWNVVGE